MGAGGSIANFNEMETVSICDKNYKKSNDKIAHSSRRVLKNPVLKIDSENNAMTSEKKLSSDLDENFPPEIVLRITYFKKMCSETNMSPEQTTLSTSQKFNHYLESSFLNMVEPRSASVSRMTLSPKPSMIQTNLCPFWPQSPQSEKTKMTRSPSSVADFL